MHSMSVSGVFQDPDPQPKNKPSSGNSQGKEKKNMPKGTSKPKARKGKGKGAPKARKGSGAPKGAGSGAGTTGAPPAKVPSALSTHKKGSAHRKARKANAGSGGTASGRRKARTTSGRTTGAVAAAASRGGVRPARSGAMGTAATAGYAVGGAGIGILGDVLISNTIGRVQDPADGAAIVNNRWTRGIFDLGFAGALLGYQLLSRRFFPKWSMSSPLAFGAVSSAAALGLFNLIRYFGSGKGLYGDPTVAGEEYSIGDPDEDYLEADEDEDMEVGGPMPLSNVRALVSNAHIDEYVASETANAIEELNAYVEQLNDDLDGFYGPMTLDQSDVIQTLQNHICDAESALALAAKQLELGGVSEARRSAEAAATVIDLALQVADALKAGVQAAEPTVATDAAGNAVTATTDAMGNTTTTTVDPAGNAAVVVTDGNGNVIAAGNVPGTGNFVTPPGNAAAAAAAMANVNSMSNVAVNAAQARANAGQPANAGGYHITVNHEQLGDLSVAAPPPEHVFSGDTTSGAPLVVFQNLIPWSYDAAARINAMTGAQPGTPGYTTPEQVALAYFFWFKYQTGERGYQFGIAPLNANGGGQWANGATAQGYVPQQAFATVNGSNWLPMQGTNFENLAEVTRQIYAGLAN